MAKSRLERSWDIDESDLDIFYLDLIRYRDISNEVEKHYNIRHESPQILIVKDGKVGYHTSHMGISVDAIRSNL